MKRFFALLMVSALLMFTGSALAAEAPVITANPASVTVTAGGSAMTVSLSATASNGGDLGAFSVSGFSGASISGSTLTIDPSSATPGSYTATVSVVETYSVEDSGGHASAQTITGSLGIPVTVEAPAPTPTISPRTASVTVAPGLTATRTVSATASQGGTLAYEKVSGPDWATLSGTTITFAPPEGTLGSFTLVIRVTETANGKTGTSDATFNIGVGYLGTLTPSITATPTSVTVNAGQTTATEVALTGTRTAGVTNSTLAFSKVNGPSWATVLTTGTVAIQPEMTTEARSYTLTVRVTERAAGWTTGTADLDIPITVQAPPFTTPTISVSLQQVTMTRGAGSITATVRGTASNAGTLEYSCSAPSWVTFNPSSGVLTLNPDATVEPDTYSATVTVTETAAGYRAGTAKAAVTIVVTKPIPPTPTPTITASTYAVSMTAGDAAQTVTLTGTASQGGTLEYEKVSGPTWATVSGNTLTLNPGVNVEGDFEVVAKVVETTGTGQDALTGSAKTDTIKVSVARSSQSTEPEKTEEEKAQEQTQTNAITGEESAEEDTETTTHEEEVTYETKTDGTVNNLPTDMTVSTSDMTDSATSSTSEALEKQGLSQEDAAQTEENISATMNNSDNLSEYSERLGIGGGSNEIIDKNEIQTEEPTGTEMDDAGTFLAGHAQNQGKENTQTVVGASSNITSKKGGWHHSSHHVKKELHHSKPRGYRNPKGQAGGGFGGLWAAAEDNGNEAIFLNSNGDVVDLIPGEDDPSGALPGVITFVTYLEPDVVYAPIIAVEVDSLPEEVQTQVEEETVEVTVTTTATSTFTAQYNSFFSTMVSWDLISSTVYTNDIQYYRISDDTGGRINHVSVGDDWTRTDAESSAMVANDDYDLTRIVRLPELDGTSEAEDHAFVVSVNFDITDANRAKVLSSADKGGFVFYPDGPLGESARARVMKVVAESGDVPAHFETLTVDEFKSSNVTKGYLAFWMPAGMELTRPMLAVKLEKTDITPEPGPTPGPDTSKDFYITASRSNVTVVLDDEESVTYTAYNASGDVSYAISPSADWVTLVPANDGLSARVDIEPEDSTLVTTSPHTFTITATDSGRTTGRTSSQTLTITVTRKSSGGGIGSSGGGCSAGWSVLALALLGGLIARKK